MLGPHVVGHRVVVRRVVRGETGPSGGPALTDVLGTCTAWGDGVCVVAARRRRAARPGHDRDRRHRLGQAGPAPRLDPAPRHAPGGAAPGARPLAGPRDRRRSATGCCAAPPPRPPAAPTRCWPWVRPGWPATTTRVVAFYESHGQRPIAAVLPDSAEDALFRSHGWVLESHDHDTVFELAGVAAARRSLHGVSLPDVDVTIDGDDHLVTAEVATRATAGCWPAGSRPTATTGSASAPSRSTPPSAAAASGSWSWTRCSSGAPSAAPPRRTSRCWATTARAFALYDGLGFTEHHRYRYLAAP